VRLVSWSEPAARLEQKMAGDWRPRIGMILDLGERLRAAGWPKPRVKKATGRLYRAPRQVIEGLWRLGPGQVVAALAAEARGV
jgi:hypothetical protein